MESGDESILNRYELIFYGRFAEILPLAQKPILYEQLAKLCVTHRHYEEISVRVPSEVSEVEFVKDSTLLDGFYDDVIGEPTTTVNIIMHFVDGRIAYIERFRFDLHDIEDPNPDPSRLRFTQQPDNRCN